MAVSDAQKRATKKWQEEHLKQIKFYVNIDSERDIIDFLDNLPKGEKAGFIKAAIRERIKQKENTTK